MYELRVTLDGREPFTVKADGRDVRAWERTFDASWFEKDVTSYTDVTFLAYNAARRAGLYAGDWDTFDGECLSVQDVTGADPTGGADTPKAVTGD